MSRDTSFENPLERAMQRGTIGGSTTEPKEPAPLPGVHDRKTSKRQAVTAQSRRPKPPAVSGKKQQTVYLDPQLIRAVKHTAVDDETDISAIVQTALEQYFERRNIRY